MASSTVNVTDSPARRTSYPRLRTRANGGPTVFTLSPDGCAIRPFLSSPSGAERRVHKSRRNPGSVLETTAAADGPYVKEG
jgi:hypothetical protein